MKTSSINLGKTATKALLITQDISSFIVSLLLAGKRVPESKYFREIHNSALFFTLASQVLTPKIIYHQQRAIHFPYPFIPNLLFY